MKGLRISVHDGYLEAKTGADIAEVWLLLVVVLLQLSEKLPLELVDVLDVAEDGLQLQLGEHVRVFATLTDVTLKVTQRMITLNVRAVPTLTNRGSCTVKPSVKRQYNLS